MFNLLIAVALVMAGASMMFFGIVNDQPGPPIVTPWLFLTLSGTAVALVGLFCIKLALLG